MPKHQKLELDELKVQSFVTDTLDEKARAEVKGGMTPLTTIHLPCPTDIICTLRWCIYK